MKFGQRQKLWAGIISAAIAVVVFAPPAQENAVVELPAARAPVPAVSAGSRQTGEKSPAKSESMLLVRARTEEEAPGAVFAAPPAPKKPTAVATAAPEAPPQAPPLPFRYLGRQVDKDVTSVFVQYGDQNLVLAVGTLIGDAYRVERIADGMVTIRYLPLNQTQTLSIGETRQ